MVTQYQPSTSNNSYVLMCTTYKDKEVTLTTRAKDYLPTTEKVNDQTSPSAPTPSGPLQIDKPRIDTVIQPPPKGVIRKSSFNLHA